MDKHRTFVDLSDAFIGAIRTEALSYYQDELMLSPHGVTLGCPSSEKAAALCKALSLDRTQEPWLTVWRHFCAEFNRLVREAREASGGS